MMIAWAELRRRVKSRQAAPAVEKTAVHPIPRFDGMASNNPFGAGSPDVMESKPEVGFRKLERTSINIALPGNGWPALRRVGSDRGRYHERRDPISRWLSQSSLEQGSSHRPETSAQAEGGLDDPRPAST